MWQAGKRSVKVRLISGEFGGRILEGSESDKTHPMGERIRNALFNKLSSMDDVTLDGAVVLDAFAGSGALGLEALSRGAQSAVFIERDRAAQNIIKNNIETLKVAGNTKLVQAPVGSWVKKQIEAGVNGARFDIIFADPPYDDLQLSTTMQLIALLQPKGLMVLSYPGKHEVPTELGIVVVDNRSYGNANLAFYQKESV